MAHGLARPTLHWGQACGSWESCVGCVAASQSLLTCNWGSGHTDPWVSPPENQRMGSCETWAWAPTHTPHPPRAALPSRAPLLPQVAGPGLLPVQGSCSGSPPTHSCGVRLRRSLLPQAKPSFVPFDSPGGCQALHPDFPVEETEEEEAQRHALLFLPGRPLPSAVMRGRRAAGGPMVPASLGSRQTMALPMTRPLLGSCGTPALGSLLFLLFSLGWVQPSRALAGETTQQALCPQEAEPLHGVLTNAPNVASLSPRQLLGFTCAEVSGLSTELVQELAVALGQKNVKLSAEQLRCLAHRLSEPPEDLDALPLDLLLFLNPDAFSGPQACTHFFSRVTKANVDLLPRGAPERQRLLPAALACWGVQGSPLSEADVQALGGLACDLPGRFVAESAEVVLPRLVRCLGPLDQDQQEAARAALQRGGPPYGPPSTWSISTLDALQGLLPVLGQPIIHSIPKGIEAAWRQRSSRDPSWRQPEQTVLRPRFRRDVERTTCPPDKEAREIDESLIFYKKWELEACVDAALLAAQMDRVNAIPFTYEQLDVLKHKLDELYPQGYPESVIRHLGHLFLKMSPEDIRKWNVTSLETLKALLKVSKGHEMSAQVATLIDRFVMGRGQLDKDTLDTLTAFCPGCLCSLSPEQLSSMTPSIIWVVRPQDLDTCGPRQLDVLYPKARLAFQNLSGSEYFVKIQSFLGGASTEDLKALSQQNVSMDLATFMKLRREAVLPLTVAEVQKLLGPHVAGLKVEEQHSPVRDWIRQQRQDDLDTLGLGLQGGIPNGYLILDLSVREALSGTSCLLGPGPVLTVLALLLASTLA
ncbi:mesothelin isoform X4 [Trachypithecus francoisi]|uniref:mesothelin isoform X4 n=1 Tax=Trachypithecus francoisi TaxID=54180 RepID=UPI00141BE3B0|nr:mesothelin isoform X4 [Trachypithecus francoisi]